MPLIHQTLTANERDTKVTILKPDGTSGKLYRPNPSPLPHQLDTVDHFTSPAFVSPCWLIFSMGSGKTFTSLLCAAALPGHQSGKRIKVTVICDVSLVGHWTKEIVGFHTPSDKRYQFNIVSYSQLEKRIRMDAVNEITKRADLVIVDECQRYRHLSDVMLPQVTAIRSSPRVLLLSGTPIVNGVEDTVGFCYLSTGYLSTGYLSTGDSNAPLSAAAAGRCLVYTPESLPRFRKYYPQAKYIRENVEMTWPQTLVYLSSKNNTFSIDVGGEKWTTSRVVNNRYGTALVSALNMPFDDVRLSPKLMKLVKTVPVSKLPAVVYSSRIEKGVKPIVDLFKHDFPELKTEYIDGSTPSAERTKIIKSFNSGNVDVMVLSPASAQGVDLKGAGSIHLLEPHANISSQDQTVARVLRFKSHFGLEDQVVDVVQYIGQFPTKASTCNTAQATMLTQVVHDLFGDGFHANTKELVAAIAKATDNCHTHDEQQLLINDAKHTEVVKSTDIIRAAALPMVRVEKMRASDLQRLIPKVPKTPKTPKTPTMPRAPRPATPRKPKAQTPKIGKGVTKGTKTPRSKKVAK